MGLLHIRSEPVSTNSPHLVAKNNVRNLIAVPAEELLEIEYRSELIKEGKIKYFGGKPEFLARGYFDGVDLAFMVHTSSSFAAHLPKSINLSFLYPIIESQVFIDL